jgi:hypothetical protein
MPRCGLLCCNTAVMYESTNISEEHVDFIFMGDHSKNGHFTVHFSYCHVEFSSPLPPPPPQGYEWLPTLQSAYITKLIPHPTQFSPEDVTQKRCYTSTRLHCVNPKDCSFNNHCHKNLKTYNM